MKSYILAIAGAVILSAALTAILPSGKTGKFIRGMCRLVVFSVVAAPLVSLFSEHAVKLGAAEVGYDENYLLKCAELLSKEDERRIEALLAEEFSLTAEAEAERGTEENFPLRKITLKVSPNGIFGQEEHINMAERIGSALSEAFGYAPELVEVIWYD